MVPPVVARILDDPVVIACDDDVHVGVERLLGFILDVAVLCLLRDDALQRVRRLWIAAPVRLIHEADARLLELRVRVVASQVVQVADLPVVLWSDERREMLDDDTLATTLGPLEDDGGVEPYPWSLVDAR